MNNVAPICPVSIGQLTPDKLAIEINSIPRAHDLLSVITVINAINNIVQTITRGAPQINNIGTPYVPPAMPAAPQYANPNWKEVTRLTSEQKVINPDDKDQEILITTLNMVTWADNLGQQLRYQGVT